MSEDKGKSEDKTAPATVDMDAQTAAEEMPDVQEHAIAAMQDERKAEIEAAKADGFNPEIHQTDEHGKPVKTKSGRWAKKRGAKPKNFKNPEAKKASEKQPGIPSADSEQSAQVVSGMLEQMSVKLLGDEWLLTDVERGSNIAAWANTFDHYGGVKISPPMALAMSHAQIILSRTQKPETKSRLKLFGAWMKTKFSFKKSKKEKDKKDARSNRGQDAIGQDDMGEEKSGGVAKAGN